MKNDKKEIQNEYLEELYSNVSTIKNLLSSYPYLIQPKFIIEYFKKQKANPILCYQYASFIRDCYENISLSENGSFTRKITGKKDLSFDISYSFGDYLCIKKNKMFKIIKQGFFDVRKINKTNTFFINNDFHINLFDPEGISLEKADDLCEKMLIKKRKNRSKKDIPEDEMFVFAENQYFIKTFGWQDGIILSQILYWCLKNKRETIFFSDLELSERLYFNRKTIKKTKIWSQDFISKEKTRSKFKIKIDMKKLIFFIKRSKEK